MRLAPSTFRASLASLVAAAAIATTGVARAQTDEVTAPEVETHVDAHYPDSAREKRAHGDVSLTLTVDADGKVSKVEVTQSGGADLDEAAIFAARQWTFRPATKGGKPVASRIKLLF